MTSARPLDNFPLIRARKVEELQEAFARVYAKPVVVPARHGDGLNAVFNNCRLRHTELSYVAFGGPVAFDFPGAAYFSLLLPVHGNGEIVTGKSACAMSVGNGTVLSAGIGHRSTYRAPYANLVLRISAATLTEKLRAMTGAAINAPLRISPNALLKEPAAQMLRLYVPRLVATLSQAQPPFPQWWMAETEQLLMLLFLCGHQHNYSHLLEPDAAAAPWQVRRAEDYIAANAERPITLEELAEVTGVSALSLYRSFKQSRGCSPLEFAKRLRAGWGCRS